MTHMGQFILINNITKNMAGVAVKKDELVV